MESINPESMNGHVAIVTGAGSGLGHAIAKSLIAAGVKVWNLDLKSSPEAGPIQFLETNLTDENQVSRAISHVHNQEGRLDIVVNSAGITGQTNIKSHETSDSDIRRVFDVNFYGSYYTSRYALPLMLERKYGRILHIASIAGKEGNAGMLAYSASKAAVIGMTKVQGKEYAGTGITVNALAPAVIQTPLVDAMPDEQVRYMTDKIPMKRCGTLNEVAQLALFIVSPANSFTTAFTFDLSGGRATY